MKQTLVDPLKKCRTTATCIFRGGHHVETRGFRTDWYRDQQLKPGSKDKVRTYIEGELLFCRRTGCDWQHLVKARTIKIVIRYEDGREEDITEEMKGKTA